MELSILKKLLIRVYRRGNLNKLRWMALVVIALVFWNFLGLVAIAAPPENSSNSSIEPYLSRFKEQITEFTLDNGLKFIVLENHDAPLISFVTYANVGGVDDPDGQT